VFGIRENDLPGEAELGSIIGAGEAVRVPSALGTASLDDTCTDVEAVPCPLPQAAMSIAIATDNEHIASIWGVWSLSRFVITNAMLDLLTNQRSRNLEGPLCRGIRLSIGEDRRTSRG
jgi:hypothetical protein